MWIRLEKEELDLILESIPDGHLAAKLRKPAHPHTQAFAGAVQTDDELEVDPDTIISRGEDGAFVMSWTWVSNEEAGFLSPDDDEEADEGPGL